MAAPPLASQATLEQRIGAVHLGLPKVLAEALSVVAVEQLLSGHQWIFSGASQEHLQMVRSSCGFVIVLLATYCPATGSNT